MVLLGWVPGYFEIGLIVLVVVVLFGPQRLPQLARAVGQSLREFKAGTKELSREEKEGEKPESPKDPGA